MYATFLGGGQSDEGQGIAVDSQGVAWITGYTKSFSGVGGAFPTTPSAFQRDLGYTNVMTAHCHGGPELSFCPDAFVAGISPDGTQLVYSTYLGGDGSDLGYAIALDGFGKVVVSGQACSWFPVTANAIQARSLVCGTGFLAKIDPRQSGAQSLVFSSFLGGTGGEEALALTTDAQGDLWIAGQTASPDFPLVTPLVAQPSPKGPSGFISRLSFP